jgi:hypothetical protein
MIMNRNRTLENNNNDPEEDYSSNIIQNSIISQKREDISSYTSKVKILLKMNNPQVTKAFNSLVGTSEAIRLLSINSNSKIDNLNPNFYD